MVGVSIEELAHRCGITTTDLRGRLNAEGIGLSGHGNAWESALLNLVRAIIAEQARKDA